MSSKEIDLDLDSDVEIEATPRRAQDSGSCASQRRRPFTFLQRAGKCNKVVFDLTADDVVGDNAYNCSAPRSPIELVEPVTPTTKPTTTNTAKKTRRRRRHGWDDSSENSYSSGPVTPPDMYSCSQDGYKLFKKRKLPWQQPRAQTSGAETQ